MRRDWSLLRVLLAHIETETIGKFIESVQEPSQWIEGQSFPEHMLDESEDAKAKRVVFEHLRLLVAGGYVDGINVQVSMDGKYSVGQSNPVLTNDGHDLLQALRSSGLWSKIKEMARSQGIELSFATVKALFPYAIKQIFEDR